MPLENILVLSQLAGHVILFILSLCVIVPMAINLKEFSGHCLLFTSGNWREEDGMFDVRWASTGFCDFPLLTGAILTIISTIQIYRYIRMKDEPSFLLLFVDVVLGIWMLAMSILSSIMITLGFIVWCDNMIERFPSCETSAGQPILYGPDAKTVDTTNFYVEMGTAQFGAWGAFAVSVAMTVIALLKIINVHQMLNIKASMYMERQRLVNQHQMQTDGRSTPPIEGCSTPPIEGSLTDNNQNDRNQNI